MKFAQLGLPLACLAGIASVGAQFVWVGHSFFHTWQYAGLLVLCAAIALRCAVRRSAFRDPSQRPAAVAVFGALIVITAGLASGLLGADTQTLVRSPGTVAPIPDVEAAAFFPAVDAHSIVNPPAIVIRRRGHAELSVSPQAPRYLGASMLLARERVAAYVEVHDAAGNHLTVTQPANVSFLSPVLLFTRSEPIEGKELPSDSLAVPALHRVIRVLYFSPADTQAFRNAAAVSGREALLFAATDEQGTVVRGEITVVPSGDEATLGSMRVRAVIGRYPELVIASVPHWFPLAGGSALFLIGMATSLVRGRARVAMLAMVFMLALPGCTRVQTSAVAGNPWTIHGTLRVGASQEPDVLNPAIGQMAFASDVYNLVFDGLIRYNERAQPIPDLALQVPSLENGGISKDGKTITYHLAHNAKWHDGVPFTADDVIFTWHAIMNPRNNVGTRNGYDRIVSIAAPDPYTVIVKFREPYAPALYLFRDLNQGSILPKHLLGSLPSLNQAAYNQKPIGTGPFILRDWHHGAEIVLEANPSYFRGRPKIDRVRWKFIPDQNTLIQQLRTHEIDVAIALPPYNYDEVKKIPGLVVKTVSTLHWEHLAFNTRAPIISDRNVRLALCYAMDEDAIFTKIYHGLGTKGPTDQNPDFEWYDHRISYYPHDVKKAGALLDAAGWRLAADGYRYKSGKRLTLVISTVAGFKTREALEVLLQSEFRAAGVDLVVKNYPAATLFAPMNAGGVLFGGKYELAIFQWVNNTPDPDDSSYIGPDWLPPQGQNATFYQNKVIGEAQHAAVRTFVFAQRKALYDRIQQEIIRDVPEYNFVWLAQIDAANSDLRGLRPAPVGSDFWNVAEWTI